jgi:hypothetical protein
VAVAWSWVSPDFASTSWVGLWGAHRRSPRFALRLGGRDIRLCSRTEPHIVSCRFTGIVHGRPLMMMGAASTTRQVSGTAESRRLTLSGSAAGTSSACIQHIPLGCPKNDRFPDRVTLTDPDSSWLPLARSELLISRRSSRCDKDMNAHFAWVAQPAMDVRLSVLADGQLLLTRTLDTPEG